MRVVAPKNIKRICENISFQSGFFGANIVIIAIQLAGALPDRAF